MQFLLQDEKLPFSFQEYYNQPPERDHVSFRVSFATVKELQNFRKKLKKKLGDTEIEERSYDAEFWVKKAYDLGTHLYLDFQESLKDLSKTPIDQFIELALHGFFNNLGASYLSEMEYYNRFTAAILHNLRR